MLRRHCDEWQQILQYDVSFLEGMLRGEVNFSDSGGHFAQLGRYFDQVRRCNFDAAPRPGFDGLLGSTDGESRRYGGSRLMAASL